MTPERWRQIEDLYNAARACGADERAALLEGSDPEIRSRVERMLAVESGSELLDLPLSGEAADATATVVTAGTLLGPYKIESKIGAGGMGTVYRAVDTRLGRVVAIKVAAERYSERFQLEARAISTLNHPNICTLYDVGPNYLVMELIEGSTLAAEINKGPLAPELAARYGAQIASALAEAHSLGIVHRDLKPSNIMVTRHGVKVLDFGLAKMVSETGVTQTGGVMGTPAYMAPEQVEGKEPGSATDLFSLGLVVYEMAVGRLPFPGASLGRMLSSGAHAPVPVPSRERVGLPAGLDALIGRLLERDPSQRPRSASDVAEELAGLVEAPSPSRLRLVYAIPAVGLLAALMAMFFLRTKLRESQPPIPNPATFVELTSFSDSATGPVLSSDGRMLAFYRTNIPFLTADDIWVKLLPNGEPVQVTHDPRPKYNVAFSPDGALIAYTATDHLFETYTVSSLGGESQLLFPNTAGLSWLDDGHLLFSQIKTGVHMGVMTSNADRSGAREIYFPAQERGMVHYSYLSPDKQWVLLAEMNPVWQPCRVVPFSGGSAGRQVGPPGSSCVSAAWSPDGKWIYMGATVAGRNHLWRQRFPEGRPEQITFGSSEEAGIAMAPDGRSLITSIITQQNTVWIHDAQGDRALSTEGYADLGPPVFSRDGKRLYYLLRLHSPESPAELWRADLASGRSEVVIPGVSIQKYDISNDEKQVVFTTPGGGQPSQLWVAPLDRSAPPHRIASSGEASPLFGPGNQVLFRFTEGSAYYLGAMNPDGTGRRKALPFKILSVNGISPDRRVLILGMTGPRGNEPGCSAVSLADARAQKISFQYCTVAWSGNGKYFYEEIKQPTRENPAGKTAAVAVPAGRNLPAFPEAVVRDFAEWAHVPGVRIVEHGNIAPGPDPSTYAYVKPLVHANLYRIPLE